MTDSLMYSDTAEHLANLDHCGSKELRRAYLAITLGAVRSGYNAKPRPKGNDRELQFRDDSERQPFALIVNQQSLLFYLRRPALDAHPELSGQAHQKFDSAVLSEPNSLNEVRIELVSEPDAEKLVDWLFAAP